MPTIQTGTNTLLFVAERTYGGYTAKRTNLGKIYNAGAMANTSYGSYEIVNEAEISIPVADGVQSSPSLGRRTEKHVGGIKGYEGSITKSRDSYSWKGAAVYGFDNGTNMELSTYITPRFKFALYEGVNGSYTGYSTGARPDSATEYALVTYLDYVIFTNYSEDATAGEIIKETIDFKYESRTSQRGTGGV